MERNILIFSDAHGDREAVKRVKEAERYFSSERLLSLGDLTPDPFDSVFSSIEGVRGNCDRFYEYGSLPFPPLDMTTTLFSKKVYMTHGHLPYEIPEGTDVVLTGHTHVPSIEKRGGIYFANPGSVSRPRSSTGPSFLLFKESGLDLVSLLDFSLIKSLSFSSS